MKVLTTMILILLISCTGGGGNRKSERHETEEEANNSETVYICTGKYSKRYHNSDDCEGLENCKGDIEEISLEDAEDQGRTACGMCN